MKTVDLTGHTQNHGQPIRKGFACECGETRPYDGLLRAINHKRGVYVCLTCRRMYQIRGEHAFLHGRRMSRDKAEALRKKESKRERH